MNSFTLISLMCEYWKLYCVGLCFFFQAEDGIRDLVRSRGLGDVYKRQSLGVLEDGLGADDQAFLRDQVEALGVDFLVEALGCLLYTSDAADERSSVDLGGRRIIKKKQIVRIAR